MFVFTFYPLTTVGRRDPLRFESVLGIYYVDTLSDIRVPYLSLLLPSSDFILPVSTVVIVYVVHTIKTKEK